MSCKKVYTEVVGMLGNNCYFISSGDDQIYIIDPGAESGKIISRIKNIGKKVKAILLTHAHVDHIGAVAEVSKAFDDATVYLPEKEEKLYFSSSNAIPPVLPAITNHAKTVREFKNTDFKIISTPGHTEVSVCFYFKEPGILFSGDTLFQESIGRTDLPGGNHQALLKSIREKLFTLPEDTKVFPGHGEITEIKFEKKNNPFL